MAMKMNQIDLKQQYLGMKDEIQEALNRVLDSTQFINGPDVEALEKEVAEYCGTKFGVAASSGTDALLIPLMARGVGPGDEILTTPFTFIATAEVAALIGAKPVFVDIEPATCNIDVSKIEAAITPRTKAIIPVHLYGQMTDMEKLNAIAKQRKIFVIEDACQAIGAERNGVKACSSGDCGALSFFPSKNLGCYGDGGMVLTNDADLAVRMKQVGNHGQVQRYRHGFVGINGRLDTMQAAILRVKLKRLAGWTDRRIAIAKRYDEGFTGLAGLSSPVRQPGNKHVYNQYTLRSNRRDELQKHLTDAGIPTAVHYPMPLHLQECFKDLGYKPGDFPVSEQASREVISLPMFPEMTPAQQDDVIAAVRSFHGK
jgi:UDP-2-acetamido-2-deoxy-ribo-hexuluronate aminotransferase